MNAAEIEFVQQHIRKRGYDRVTYLSLKCSYIEKFGEENKKETERPGAEQEALEKLANGAPSVYGRVRKARARAAEDVRGVPRTVP